MLTPWLLVIAAASSVVVPRQVRNLREVLTVITGVVAGWFVIVYSVPANDYSAFAGLVWIDRHIRPLLPAAGFLPLMFPLWRAVGMAFRQPTPPEGVSFAGVRADCPRCRDSVVFGDAEGQCARCRLRIRMVVAEHQCNQCGYVMRGVPSQRCPECGATETRQ